MDARHLEQEARQLLEDGGGLEWQHTERMFSEWCRGKEVMRVMRRKVMLRVVVNGGGWWTRDARDDTRETRDQSQMRDDHEEEEKS